MIADDRDTPFETAVKMITAPVWVPIYFAYVGCRKLAEAWSRRKPKEPTTEILPPGEPVNNRRLAELMDCSPGEASRRVAQLVQAELGSAKTAALRKARKGREVLISLN